MIKVGVIGYGYWGPNIARNFNIIESAKLIAICDSDKKARERARKMYPYVNIVANSDDIIKSKDIDVIAIVTPVSSHFNLAKKALQNGKHIFIEKPFISNSVQGEELIQIAEKKKLTIMVDHTYIFTGSIKKIKELIDNKIVGNLFYYDSTRVNLGLFQHDVNVIWDLAVHDVAIMDFLINKKPVAVSATGSKHFCRDLEDVAFLTLYFNDNFIAHFNVNWLSPVKIRLTLIGGDKKMVLWNDLESDEKIKIYDKGVDIKTVEGKYKLLVDYRSGDMYAPKLERKEALKTEIEYFIECIEKNKRVINDGYAGLRVIKILEASNKSLKKFGRYIKL
ncbi:MAG: Gfo/Idh/MocA family oxidoreductase [Candidatus Hydrogenedentota bacterium]